jgi:hypothetical protein
MRDMRTTIDTAELKQRVDLRDLAGQFTTLRRESSSELSGPCPKCGGDDRFHVKQDTFFCRSCYDLGNGKPHDAIAFPEWLGKAIGFKESIEWLGGAPTGPANKPTPVAKPKVREWQSDTWQADARQRLAAAVAKLAGPEGAPGRKYLTDRGLLPETWRAWGLGYELYDSRPAIVLPWQRERITALKFRFIGAQTKGERYISLRGSECVAFGLQMAVAPGGTLWLLEGEFNAVSVWQALRDAHCVNYDVISIGSDSKAAHLDDMVTKWAGRYRQVIIWADDPEKAAAAVRGIPGALGLRSPVYEGAKLDASEMLQRGVLADFARAAWQELDQDPAYIARMRAEVL